MTEVDEEKKKELPPLAFGVAILLFHPQVFNELGRKKRRTAFILWFITTVVFVMGAFLFFEIYEQIAQPVAGGDGTR